ncbi:MAG TPA: hypothetical protein VER35_00235 [Candidatus Limnocylindrales bacterium]|nr:hypothetical protein [Candidatus Limnocylindrales bacterium]
MTKNIFSSYEKSVITQVLDEIAESVFDDLDSLDVESDWEEVEEIHQKEMLIQQNWHPRCMKTL